MRYIRKQGSCRWNKFSRMTRKTKYATQKCESRECRIGKQVQGEERKYHFVRTKFGIEVEEGREGSWMKGWHSSAAQARAS
jgi:hypothetical protein